MKSISIRDKNIFKIIDETNENTYGTNQEWYTKRWQRLSGCGPSAATNIMYYLNSTREFTSSSTTLTKKSCLSLMNEMWNYVTPGIGGVSSTSMFCKGVEKYLLDKKLNIILNSIDIPKNNLLRPDLGQIIVFLVKALKEDSPVAFLNLEHGTIYELDSWHWVTIISLEYELDNNIAFVTILDGGFVKKIELSRWLQTTKLGGGFVSFET